MITATMQRNININNLSNNMTQFNNLHKYNLKSSYITQKKLLYSTDVRKLIYREQWPFHLLSNSECERMNPGQWLGSVLCVCFSAM